LKGKKGRTNDAFGGGRKKKRGRLWRDALKVGKCWTQRQSDFRAKSAISRNGAEKRGLSKRMVEQRAGWLAQQKRGKEI